MMNNLKFLISTVALLIINAIPGYNQMLLYPDFKIHNIDTLRSGYKVETEDINMDGKPDVVALATTPSALVWFENPGWQRHIISGKTYRNISMAFEDMDGDGRRDLALASYFNLPEPDQGMLQWLKKPLNPSEEWVIEEMKTIPSIHRIIWTDLNNDGKNELVIAPTLGPGAKAPEYNSKTTFSYAIPSGKGKYRYETINKELTVLHGITSADLDKDGTIDLLTASFEGVSVFYNKINGNTNSFVRKQIGKGEQDKAPRLGTSEVETGILSDGSLFIATIEPWHGNQLVIYTHPSDPDSLWIRTVLDQTYNQGHALAVGDLNGDGSDEIVAGFRGRGTSLYVYTNRDKDGRIWERTLLDGNMAASGISISDINTDGKPDIVAIGTSTNNIRWYENNGFKHAESIGKVCLVLEKGLNGVAFYSSDGKRLSNVITGKNPHEMAINPEGTIAWVTNTGTMRYDDIAVGEHFVSVVDLKLRKKVGDIDISPSSRPHGIFFDKVSGLLSVSTEYDNQILIIDPGQGKVIKRFPVRGITPHMTLLTPGAEFGFTSNTRSSTVSRINIKTGKTDTITVAPSPQGLCLSADGSRLFVSCLDRISVIDVKTARVTGYIPADAIRIALNPDGNILVFASRKNKSIGFADPNTLQVTGEIKLPYEPFSISISPDGLYAFASAEVEEMVYVVSLAEKKAVNIIKTVSGSRPDPAMYLW
jgi:DNA-binding beta-propeller fold protein YncE